MSQKAVFAITMLACLSSTILTPIALAQNEGTANSPAVANVDQAWRTLQAIEKTVYEHHISPPTRQQMYLAATQGLYVGNRMSANSELPQQFSAVTAEEDFRSLFSNAWKEVAQQKAFSADHSIRFAGTAMLHAAGHSSSRFLTADEHRVTSSIKENQYVGIGIQIGMHGDIPVIHKSFYGGAAHHAGAGSKDLIVKVDDSATKGRDLGGVVNQLRGPKGSKVIVHVQQIDSEKVREYEMVRTVIPIDSIEGVKRASDGQWKLTSSANPDIAILDFQTIVGSTAAELTNMARRLEQRGIKKVIFNMQAIATAAPHHVVMLADVLLDNQALGVISRRKQSEEFQTRAGSVFADDVQIAVVTPSNVDGGILLLMANLKNCPNVTFVGKDIRSTGLTTNLFALPDTLGAVDQLPDGICYSELFKNGQSPIDNPINGSYASQIRFQVDADLGQDLEPTELLQAAIKAFK